MANHAAGEQQVKHNGSNGKQLAHDKASVGISSRNIDAAADYIFAQGWPVSLPPPVYKRVPRYAVGDRAVLDHLSEHGFAVVRDVMSPAEVALGLEKLWDYMEGELLCSHWLALHRNSHL